MSRIAKPEFLKAEVFGRRLNGRAGRDPFPTGCNELDRLTGGFPRSAIVEICGHATSGRTAFVFAALARLLRGGHLCAYVDGTNAFDPHSAFQTELPTTGLLWLRCGSSIDKTLAAADTVLQAGGFSLIVVDMADFPVAELEKIPPMTWLRFQRRIEKQPSTMLVLSKFPLAKTAAGMVVSCRLFQSRWHGRRLPVLDGLTSELAVSRPGPRRGATVVLNSYSWQEHGNVRRHSFPVL